MQTRFKNDYMSERAQFWENYERLRQETSKRQKVPVKNMEIFAGSQKGIKDGTKNVTIEMVFRMADMLDITPAQLFEGITIERK